MVREILSKEQATSPAVIQWLMPHLELAEFCKQCLQ